MFCSYRALMVSSRRRNELMSDDETWLEALGAALKGVFTDFLYNSIGVAQRGATSPFAVPERLG
jgi:hypothetical protein